MKQFRILLVVLHVFVGIGALAGGGACIANPDSPFGAPLSMLEGSPFSSYLVPGIVLFGFLGIGNCIGALMVLRNNWLKAVVTGILGAGLMIWILVQVFVIHAVAFLHVLFFCIGVFQSISAIIILVKEKTLVFEHLKMLSGRIRKS